MPETFPSAIFIDGIDGVGKTTLIKALHDYLDQYGGLGSVIPLRLPEDFGRVNYREIIKKGPRTGPDNIRCDLAMEDALLVFANFMHVVMAQRVTENKTGFRGVVLCDRSLETMRAYQHDLFSNPDYAHAYGVLKHRLYAQLGETVTFVLKPPVSFVMENLKDRGGDKIDTLVAQNIQGWMDRYPHDTTYPNVIVVLRDPKTYLTDILEYLGILKPSRPSFWARIGQKWSLYVRRVLGR